MLHLKISPFLIFKSQTYKSIWLPPSTKNKTKAFIWKSVLLRLTIHLKEVIMIVQVTMLKSEIQEAQDEYKRLLAEVKSLDLKEE